MTAPDAKKRRRRLVAGALVPAALLATAVIVNQWTVARSLWLVVSMRSSTNSIAQLFYDVGNGLNEADASIAGVRRLPTFSDYRFRLPARAIDNLRFDPFTCPGALAIRSIHVEDGRGRPIRRIALSTVAPAFQIAEYQEKRGKLLVETAKKADDPQLMIQLDSPIRTDFLALGNTMIRSWLVVFLVASCILLAVLGGGAVWLAATRRALAGVVSRLSRALDSLARPLARGNPQPEVLQKARAQIIDLLLFAVPVILFMAWNWGAGWQTRRYDTLIGQVFRQHMGFRTGLHYVHCGASIRKYPILFAIEPGGIMEQAGFQNGDILLRTPPTDFYRELYESRGKIATVEVREGGDGPRVTNRTTHYVPLRVPDIGG